MNAAGRFHCHYIVVVATWCAFEVGLVPERDCYRSFKSFAWLEVLPTSSI